MKQPTPQQLEEAMRREWDYLDRSIGITTNYTAVEIIPVIWESIKTAVDAITNGHIEACLMEVLKIATIADGFRIKSTVRMRRMGDFQPDKLSVPVANRLKELCDSADHLSLGDSMMYLAFLSLLRCCKYTIFEHGLFERFGDTAVCPSCGYQVKRMAHHNGQGWNLFWGCDNDCGKKGLLLGVLGNSNKLVGGHRTREELVLLNYQIV